MSNPKSQNGAGGYPRLMAKLASAGANAIRCEAVDVEPPPTRRGRPRKGARIWVRLDRGEAGIAYMVGDGPKRSLGIAGDDMEAAEDAARLRRLAADARALGIYTPRSVPLAAVFGEYKQWSLPEMATVEQQRDWEQICKRLDRVLGRLGRHVVGRDITVGDITPEHCRAYDRWLRSQPQQKRKDHLLSVGSSRMDLGFARAAVNRYAFEHTVALPNGFWVPDRPPPRQNWLTRSQIARLVWAAHRGWIWDSEKECWKTETVIDADTGETATRRAVVEGFDDPEVRERLRQAIRALLVLYYTGTRSTKACELVWHEHPYRGWIDVRRGTIRRTGVLVGNYAGPGRQPKPAGTSYLPVALRHLARRWHAADMAKGHRAVFRRPDGRHHDSHSLLKLVREVAKMAGIPDVIVHEFRHSTVTHLLLAGCSTSQAAAFVDMSEEMVRRTYGHGSRSRRSPAPWRCATAGTRPCSPRATSPGTSRGAC